MRQPVPSRRLVCRAALCAGMAAFVPKVQAGPPLRLVAGLDQLLFNVERHGELQGLGADIAREFLRRAGATSAIEAYPWTRALAMARKAANVLVFALPRTPENEDDFIWLEAILPRDMWLWRLRSRTDIGATTLEELKHHVVASFLGGACTDFLLAQGFVAGANLDITVSPRDVARKIARGRVDLAPVDRRAMAAFAQEAGLAVWDFEPVVPICPGGAYYFALSRRSDAMQVQAARHVFDGMRQDGSIKRMLARWGA